MSGVVFLGVPHLPVDKELAENQLDIMLRAQTLFFPKRLFTKTDNATLTDMCKEFETVDLQVPIESICETKATKVQESRFARFRKSRSMVVGRRPYILLIRIFAINFLRSYQRLLRRPSPNKSGWQKSKRPMQKFANLARKVHHHSWVLIWWRKCGKMRPRSSLNRLLLLVRSNPTKLGTFWTHL